MKKNFLERFVESKRRVTIYAIIKTVLAVSVFYLFFNETDLIKKIIYLAGGFILLMSMVPVVTLFSVNQQKKKKEIQAEKERNSSE